MCILAALGAPLTGCNTKILDPGQIGRFRPTPAVNVILNSLGVAEETPVAWESAQEPAPGDIVAVQTDYALRPGDLVRVSIFELFQEGVAVINDYIVSETGKISIPDVGVLPAAGLTERQLEDEIKRILSPNILREPPVTVALLDSQQRTFSILGNAVARPSRYLIPRYDFRLADALATAGAQMQFNVSTIYVSRRGEAAAAKQTSELKRIEPGSPPRPEDRGPRTEGRGPRAQPSSVLRSPSSEIPKPSVPAQKFESEREMLDLIAPQAQGTWPQSEKVVGSGSGTGGRSDIAASVVPDGLRVRMWRRYTGPTLSDPGAPAVAKTQGHEGRAAAGEVVSPIEFGSPQPELPRTEAKSRARTEWVFRDGKWVSILVTDEAGAAPGVPGPTAAPPGPGEELEWAFRDGRWVAVPKGQAAGPRPPGPEPRPQTSSPGPQVPGPLPLELEWEQAIQTRLIRIPADKLLAGDPRYNIVIQPGDTIHVPVDIIGEFAIMGNVNRSGYIDITGRPMTLKMAIAAAGGLGPLAWPKNVEVVRRIGTAREEIVMVDLDKIASGEQPDFFIKPNDLINVGTHPTARWRAVLRNAFRATYGFGFVYDRNFADIDYGEGFPWFRRF